MKYLHPILPCIDSASKNRGLNAMWWQLDFLVRRSVRAMGQTPTLDLQSYERTRTENVNGVTFCLLPMSNVGEGQLLKSS